LLSISVAVREAFNLILDGSCFIFSLSFLLAFNIDERKLPRYYCAILYFLSTVLIKQIKSTDNLGLLGDNPVKDLEYLFSETCIELSFVTLFEIFVGALLPVVPF